MEQFKRSQTMTADINRRSASLPRALLFSVLFCAALLAGFGICQLLDISMPRLGIYPRNTDSLLGIILVPLLHGSWSHVINNVSALLLLMAGLYLGYPRSRWYALAVIWIGSGILTWIFARDSYHFGASGLSHGLFFYLLLIGLLRRDKRSTALLMIAFFLYGGMLMSIFPGEPGISYELHLFGAFMGVLMAVLMRHRDPLPERKRYSWEEEDESDLDEDPYWLTDQGDKKDP
ncbi:rhomboid family intramembrane serine protease [Pseudoteredinibacter isoporae]|uniref:rhomboid family intramembrane serine protease n=1 Tax=Pseudoteredinibacter isoporae TaxID=570281 RepID=UPI00310BD270